MGGVPHGHVHEVFGVGEDVRHLDGVQELPRAVDVAGGEINNILRCFWGWGGECFWLGT